jgi:uncharacterized protein involved in response to NO
VSASGERAAVWPPFVRVALAIGLLGGFALGAALFVAILLGLPLGPWWRAAAQAHGHAQLFGWLGLMILGVGLHFMPRLRGAPLARPGLAPLALGLVAGGVTVRLVAAPTAALEAGVAAVARAGLVAASAAELAGLVLAVVLLAATLRRGSSLADRAALRAVLPFFAVGFVALLAAAAVVLAGTLEMALAGEPWLPAWANLLGYDLVLYLFVVPLCVGMSARTFPLFLRTPLPAMGPLRAGLVALVGGTLARMCGGIAGAEPLVALGMAAQGAALIASVVGLGILSPARPLPRDPVPYPPDPARLLGQSAYAWLLLAALLLIAGAADRLDVASVPLRDDVERHLLGAGFATPLIFGVGAHLLRAFAGRRACDRRAAWALLGLGNAAALARVGPYLWPGDLPAAAAYGAFAAAGLLGVVALLVFARVAAPRG